MFNNNKITVSEYTFKNEKVFDEIRIAHLSDLHEKIFGTDNTHLYEKTAEIKPHIIAVTGDIILHEKQNSINVAYIERLSQKLSKIAPTYFVTGNHEKKFSPNVEDAFAANGVCVLKNQMECIKIGNTSLNISGNDDISFDNVEIAHSFDNFLNIEGYNIFLIHRPEHFELLENKNIDLILCGHTHAGQVRFPFVVTFYMKGQGLFPKYLQGEFSKGDTKMVISRGLGSSGYPAVRVNNPPDLVKITIQPKV